MLRSKELRARAWESLKGKGKYWMAFLAVVITGLICSVEGMLVSYAGKMAEIPQSVDPALIDKEAAIGGLFIYIMALGVALIGLIFGIFLSNPATIGCCNYFIKNTSTKPAIFEVLSGFKTKYGRNIKTMLLMSIKLVLWTMLFIIPGIIKAYEYAMIPYILADNPELSSKEVFAKSKQMMNGNKWRFFKLEFSFIGWILLCIPTLGIGAFFLMPYIEAANAEFYAEIKNN